MNTVLNRLGINSCKSRSEKAFRALHVFSLFTGVGASSAFVLHDNKKSNFVEDIMRKSFFAGVGFIVGYGAGICIGVTAPITIPIFIGSILTADQDTYIDDFGLDDDQ
jgi:hypothetical protein